MTYVLPTSVADITQALVERLRADPFLENVRVERSEEEPMGPEAGMFVGVYRLSSEFNVRTLGSAGSRLQKVQLAVLVKAQDPSSGSACEDTMEELVRRVVACILSDATINNTVQFVDEFSVSYPSYEKISALYVQTALIQFAAFTTTTLIGG